MMKLKTWSDKITFGKHKGRTVRQVMDYPDAQYLWWLIDKTDKTDFPHEMQQEIYTQAHGDDDSITYGYDRHERL